MALFWDYDGTLQDCLELHDLEYRGLNKYEKEIYLTFVPWLMWMAVKRFVFMSTDISITGDEARTSVNSSEVTKAFSEEPPRENVSGSRAAHLNARVGPAPQGYSLGSAHFTILINGLRGRLFVAPCPDMIDSDKYVTMMEVTGKPLMDTIWLHGDLTQDAPCFPQWTRDIQRQHAHLTPYAVKYYSAALALLLPNDRLNVLRLISKHTVKNPCVLCGL